MAALETPKIEGLDLLPTEEWPAEADLIISALDVGDAESGVSHDNRRRHPRMRYRVIADLRLFSDQPGSEPWRLYSRDVSARGLGFVTPHRLPLGYGGIVQ